MVEIFPNIDAIFRFLEHNALFRTGMMDDPGYAIHLWLKSAFGRLAPKPYRLYTKKGLPARILAYSQHDAASLKKHFEEFAEPSVIQGCPSQKIFSKVMPVSWTRDRILKFEVQCCPLVRRGKAEKDAFLAALDREKNGAALKREAVYLDWLQSQLKPVSQIFDVHLDAFRLQPLLRRGSGTGRNRTYHKIVRPSCLFSGGLRIGDPEAFMQILQRGIGRHRAFGFGMLLLRPA